MKARGRNKKGDDKFATDMLSLKKISSLMMKPIEILIIIKTMTMVIMAIASAVMIMKITVIMHCSG